MADDVDARLLRAHAGGDPQAFADLLARYRDRVLNLVRCRLGTRSLWLEDVAQDVFVQVHRRAASFEGRSSVKTWLYSVAINVCLDHQRHERRRGAGAVDLEGPEPLAQLPDSSLDPLEQLEQQRRDALVRAAFDDLPPGYRMVLHMREREDMSYQQIAVALDVPIGTVRSRLHNARAALGELLASRLKGMAT